MKDKRQGNDLKVAWSIFMQDGEPFRLDGKDVSLYLKNMFGRKKLNDFVTTGNIIQWTFYGKDQKNSGKYSLELVINEGEKGMITTDKCDFVNLVDCSCKLQGGEDAPNVETESIELTSTLEYVAGGGSYDDTALWRELENKVDKVEGLGLSEENYTNEEKEKLAGLENYDDTKLKEEIAETYATKEYVDEAVANAEGGGEGGSSYDDTELREAIEDLDTRVAAHSEEIANLQENKADKSELTELSAEVSGLSERIENLPSAESSVFEAVYGETTYDEIVEAVKAKKHIICFHKNRVYNLCNFQQGMDLLFTCAAAAIYTITLKIKDSKWVESQYDYEIAINKVTTINESSTNAKYPSAKAVYDFVSNTLGTIINGDY